MWPEGLGQLKKIHIIKCCTRNLLAWHDARLLQGNLTCTVKAFVHFIKSSLQIYHFLSINSSH
jgi:hypothetical protein